METNNIFVANGLIGSSNPIHQEGLDTCAIKAQQIILNEFGIPCTEAQLVQFSYEHGWYNGNGTSPENVGNLLEVAGIHVTRQANANIFNLVSELAQGHKVIVGVDADELWHNSTEEEQHQNWLEDFNNDGGIPDHALIVAGIDTSDPNNIQVLLTDPGTGDCCKAYPLDQFMDAWSDSQCYMVSTDVAVPQSVPGMENFNPEVGHLDFIAGVPYTDFQIFNDMSYGIPVFAPLDFGYCYPMNSFVDAFFDFAHQDIGYVALLNNQYLFTDYMNHSLIIPQLVNTYDLGLPNIAFNPMNDWNHYAFDHHVGIMTNDLYNDFLTQSIMDFNAIGDIQSAMYCEQQMMMLDYCNHYNYDFYDTFYCSPMPIV